MPDQRSRGVAIGLALTMLAHLPESTALAVPLRVDWQNQAPRQVQIARPDLSSQMRLTPDAEQRTSTGDYDTGSGGGFIPVVLRATWEDGNETALPIYLWSRPEGFSIPLYRVQVDNCTPPDRRGILEPSGDVATTLQRVARAEALFRMEGEDRCQGSAREDVARAWFDRSFELMRLAGHFRLDPRAAAALRQYQPAYVDRFYRQGIGRGIQVVNDLKVDALNDGRLEDALAINAALIAAMDDAEYRDIATDLQGLPLEVLTADQEVITQAVAARPETPENSASPPEFNLTLPDTDIAAEVAASYETPE